MIEAIHTINERDDRLHAILASYVEAMESGQPVNPEEWLSQHDDFRSELLSFLNLHNQIHNWTTPLRPGDDTPIPRPMSFDGFDFLGEIGHGGMGVVYKARQRGANRIVALKLLRAGQFASAHHRRRFRQEIVAAARLDHPRIVPIYEVGECDGLPYFTMRYIEGKSLAEPAVCPSTPRDIAIMMLAIARAIHHAHERGILHRDLKPSNILLDTDGRPHIADFGLAKDVTIDEALTGTGEIVGTPAYMSPEQSFGVDTQVTISVDVYGLGAILYYLLSGRAPFQGKNTLAILEQVRSHDPVLPYQSRINLPRDLEAICLKCLEKDPKKRYATADDVANELSAFLDGKPIAARPPGNVTRSLKWIRRHPTRTVLLAGMAAALIAFISGSVFYTLQIHHHNHELLAAVTRAETGEKRVQQEAYANQIVIADALRTSNQISLLSKVLQEYQFNADDSDPRGFEWYYLRGKANQRLIPARHREWASVQFFVGSTKVASIGRDLDLKIWDASTGKLIATWPIEVGRKRLDNAIFSSDGTRLLCCANDPGDVRSHRELSLWDVSTGTCLVRKDTSALSYEAISMSREGNIVVFLSEVLNEAAIRIWDTKTGEIRIVPVKFSRHPDYLGLSPDGKYLAITYGHKSIDPRQPFAVETWDLTSGRQLSRYQLPSGTVNEIVMSPNNQWLIVACWGNGPSQIWLSKLGEGKARLLLENKSGNPAHVAFSADSKLLATGAETGHRTKEEDKLSLWNLESGIRMNQNWGMDSGISQLAFAPDLKSIAAGCVDGNVRLCEIADGHGDATLTVRGKKEAWSVAFSPDSRQLAVGYDDEPGLDRETLMLWNLQTHKVLANLSGHVSMVSQVAFLPDGRTLASSGYDKVVKIWDTQTFKLTETLTGPIDRLRCLAASPDGNLLAAAGWDNDIHVWNVKNKRIQHVLKSDGFINRVAFSPDSTTLTSADFHGEMICWDMKTGNRVSQFQDSSRVVALSYSPDGRVVVSGNGEGVAKFWDLNDLANPRSLLGHKGEARSLAFSADGKTLATGGGDDGSIRLWQVSTGRELIVFGNLPAKINSLAFSPDGRQLAAALHDGSVRIWNAAGR